MNRWVLAAAALSCLTLAVHVFGGGRDVHEPLLAAGLPADLRLYVSVTWHAVTAVLLADTIALVVAAFVPTMRRTLVVVVIGQYLAYAALFVVYGIDYLGTLLTAPQWIVFLAIAALGAPGLRAAAGEPAPVAA